MKSFFLKGSSSFAALAGVPGTVNDKRSIIIIGDSMTNQNNGFAANQSFNQAQGYMTWLQVFSGHRWSFSVPGNTISGGNFGVSGDTTALVLARFDPILAASPDWAIVMIGTNDVNNDAISAATTIANLETIYTRLQAIGTKIIAIPILPRTFSSSARRLKSMTVSTWIRNYNRNYPDREQIIVVDPSKYWLDSTSATGDNLASVSHDNLHPNVAGAYYIGKALWEVLQPYAPPPIPHVYQSAADLYDATANLRGNLLTNGMLNGSGGTQTVGTGTLATNWTSQRGVGSTIACVNSKGATKLDGTAGTHQIQVWSTNSTGVATESGYLTQNITTNFTAGDIVEAICEISVSGHVGANLHGVALTVRTTGGTAFTSTDLNPYDETRLMPAIAFTGVLKTQPFAIPVGATTVTTRVVTTLDGTKTGSVQVAVDRIILRKVISP